MASAPELKKHADINKVLIVGPNGNIGTRLIPVLLKLGYKVRAFGSELRVDLHQSV